MNALLLIMESTVLIDIWTVVQTCWNLQRLCGFIWLFLIHVNYYCFHSLKLSKVYNIYPRSIKSLLGITSTPGWLKVYLRLVLTVTNLKKVLWSFTTIDYRQITMKVSFWTWFSKITLTASTSIFQSFIYLKSTQGRCIIYSW